MGEERTPVERALEALATISASACRAAAARYFGGAVNLAAQLLALAGGGELLAPRAAVERASAAGKWTAIGSHKVRGLRADVEIFRLADAAPRA